MISDCISPQTSEWASPRRLVTFSKTKASEPISSIRSSRPQKTMPSSWTFPVWLPDFDHGVHGKPATTVAPCIPSLCMSHPSASVILETSPNILPGSRPNAFGYLSCRPASISAAPTQSNPALSIPRWKQPMPAQASKKVYFRPTTPSRIGSL